MARWDHRVLLECDLARLDPLAQACVLSQYRFLRAVEAGFGGFALLYRQEIMRQRLFNRLFLGTLAFGVVARLISLPLDGRPSWVFFVFLAEELLALVTIRAYSRKLMET